MSNQGQNSDVYPSSGPDVRLTISIQRQQYDHSRQISNHCLAAIWPNSNYFQTKMQPRFNPFPIFQYLVVKASTSGAGGLKFCQKVWHHKWTFADDFGKRAKIC